MADSGSEDRFLSISTQDSIIRDVDKNDTTSPHVRSVRVILKDVIENKIDCIQGDLQDLLPPDLLFDSECQVNNRIFFSVRRVLEDIGVQQASDRSRGRVSIKVAHALYKNQDDREEAENRVRAFLQPKQTQVADTTRTMGVANSSTGIVGHSLARNKATVTSSFREEDKFTGSVSGKVPLHRVRNRFLDAVRDQAIPRQEEVSLLHSCLSGMALDYYYKHIRNILTNKDEAFGALERRFNSLQHQAQARTYLNSMSLEGIKKEKNCGNLEALEMAHTRISDTVPNCGKEYQQESHYCDFLEGVVRQQPWAHPVIQSRLTPSSETVMDYNTFYSKLVAALTIWETIHRTSAEGLSTNESHAPVFFGERYATPHVPRKTRYARHNTSPRTGNSGNSDISSMVRGPNRVKSGMSASRLAQLKARTKCLFCKKYGHWRQECPERHKKRSKDVMLSLVQCLGNDSVAVAKALWTITEDDDEYFAYVGHVDEQYTEDDASAPNPFESLVNSIEATTPYGDADACADLHSCFDDIADNFVSYANANEAEDFMQPMRT